MSMDMVEAGGVVRCEEMDGWNRRCQCFVFRFGNGATETDSHVASEVTRATFLSIRLYG